MDKSRLKHNRGRYEDPILSRLKEVLPEGVMLTIVADRGFAERKFFEFIEQHYNLITSLELKPIQPLKMRKV